MSAIDAILWAMSGGTTFPLIDYSLRFNSSSSQYLSRTFGVPTDNKKWTWSGWVKRSGLGTLQKIFARTNASNPQAHIYFDTNDTLRFEQWNGTSYDFWKYTTAVFRDPTAWMHIVAIFDSNNGTAEDRNQIWVNGVRITSWSSSGNAGAGAVSGINENGIAHYVSSSVGVNCFEGYQARIAFVDGSALTPSSFAYTDSNNQWRSKSAADVKAVVDAGGTNSFMLDFNNGTTTTTLGYDYSSKGNNWTLTNFTRSTGVSDCWMTDTPTNNYATLNIINQNGSNDIQNGALYCNNVVNQGVLVPTIAMISGKYSCEVIANKSGSANTYYGVRLASVNVDNSATPWADTISSNQAAGWYDGSGTYTASGGASWSSGDTLTLGWDADTGTLTIRVNNVAAFSYTKATWIGLPVYFTECSSLTSTWNNWNFGQRGGTYTKVSGFKDLCISNLPTGSITISGSFTGDASANGPVVWLNGTPTTMTINGNAVTWGTHADKLAGGFKLRTNSASYNASGSNTFTVTANSGVFKYANAQMNP